MHPCRINTPYGIILLDTIHIIQNYTIQYKQNKDVLTFSLQYDYVFYKFNNVYPPFNR